MDYVKKNSNFPFKSKWGMYNSASSNKTPSNMMGYIHGLVPWCAPCPNGGVNPKDEGWTYYEQVFYIEWLTSKHNMCYVWTQSLPSGLSVMHSDDDNDARWYIHKISYINLIS